MTNNNVTRGDIPLNPEDRQAIDKFKDEIKASRPDRYGQNKDKK